MNIAEQIELIHPGNAILDVRVVDQEKRWVLATPFWPVWEHGGDYYCMPIDRGYAYDGSSVPRALWWAVAPFELGLAAPCKHDWLHDNAGLVEMWKLEPDPERMGRWFWVNLGKKQWEREQADRMFFRDMRENPREIPRWARRGAYKGVRLWSRVNGDQWKGN